MTVRFHGTFGGRSLPQVNAGSTTTHFGSPPALLSDDGSRSSRSPPTLYANSALLHLIVPLTDLAYGSISSCAGLKRCPSSGLYGPCTRYPYSCPGRTSGR